ncbi:MAG: hypothetical protein ACD_12C00760G0002 [uncultured bacterium]|nr:MAG: hypothetical protein ACD_12C00760G0002 [uncultured bacterium]
MIIKPLEVNNNRSALLKTFFLVTLVVLGILLDKVFFKKSQDTPSILGKNQKIELQAQKELARQVQESHLVEDSIKKAEEFGGVVLGEATDAVNKLVSDSGSFVSEVIYNSSIGKVVDQIDKLPKDQQEKIREQICK